MWFFLVIIWWVKAEEQHSHINVYVDRQQMCPVLKRFIYTARSSFYSSVSAAILYFNTTCRNVKAAHGTLWGFCSLSCYGSWAGEVLLWIFYILNLQDVSAEHLQI